jgi:hypothetical protein
MYKGKLTGQAHNPDSKNYTNKDPAYGDQCGGYGVSKLAQW